MLAFLILIAPLGIGRHGLFIASSSLSTISDTILNPILMHVIHKMINNPLTVNKSPTHTSSDRAEKKPKNANGGRVMRKYGDVLLYHSNIRSIVM